MLPSFKSIWSREKSLCMIFSSARMRFNHSKLWSLPSTGRPPCNIIIISYGAFPRIRIKWSLSAKEPRSSLSEIQCLTQKRTVKEAANDRQKVDAADQKTIIDVEIVITNNTQSCNSRLMSVIKFA